MPYSINKRQEQGQVLIIILLVMIVGLTSGLYLLSQNTTDISLSSKIEESARAFNAAEAGIEEAIRSGVSQPNPSPLAAGVTYQVAVSDLSAAAGSLYPATIEKPVTVSDAFTIWLVPHDASGNLVESAAQAYKQNTLDVCFTTASPEPALGVSIYYKTAAGVYSTTFSGYDPNAGRRSSNNFHNVNASGACGASYNYQAAVSLRNDFGVDLTAGGVAGGVIPLAMKIQPFYADASIAVIPQGAALAKQGNQIASTGTSGGTARKIEVKERHIVPAPFMNYAIYSTGNSDLTK